MSHTGVKKCIKDLMKNKFLFQEGEDQSMGGVPLQRAFVKHHRCINDLNINPL